MRRALLLLALLGWLLAGCGGRAGSEAAAAVTPFAAPVMEGSGEEAYDFTLERLDGGTWSLGAQRGGWVLLNFWATWCPPCVKEMPYLEELAHSRELAVVGVNMNEKRAIVETFVAEHGITFPILLDPDDVVKIMYEARALPRTVLIAPDGTQAGLVLGAVAPESLELWLDEHGVPRL